MEDHTPVAPFEPRASGKDDKQRQHPPEHQVEKDHRQHERKTNHEVDETVEDTFPASDPPAWY